jgi:DNA-binding NarL/FixJ family response regulator
MSNAHTTPRPGARAIGELRPPADPTAARYEHELAGHVFEVARLRVALARAEALLLKFRDSASHAIDAKPLAWQEDAADRVASLTPRQREIMILVVAGCPSKNIAADLGITRRTVENHRAEIMKKTGSKSLPALGRFGLAAAAPAVPVRG